MPTYYAVICKRTGEVRSYGTVIAPPEVLAPPREDAPDGLEAIALGDAMPDLTTHRWDPVTRTHVPVKVKR